MRAWNKLSASFVRSVRREGRYSDGGNLYLQVANGGRSWISSISDMAASATWASAVLARSRSHWRES